MTSITLTLDHHDFLAAVEGFARGSHLRQHVWSDIVFRSIRQMDEEFMDYLWFMLCRNLWGCYFSSFLVFDAPGAGDYLQCLAALHRGNRYNVVFRVDGKGRKRKCVAYRFQNKLHPLVDDKGVWASFNAYIPDEWIVEAVQAEMPENKFVEQGMERWWTDLTAYDREVL